MDAKSFISYPPWRRVGSTRTGSCNWNAKRQRSRNHSNGTRKSVFFWKQESIIYMHFGHSRWPAVLSSKSVLGNS